MLNRPNQATANFTPVDVLGDESKSFTLTLTVTDSNGISASDKVMVTVKPLAEFDNSPPIVPDEELTLVDSGSTASVVMTSSDPDGDPLSYLWQQLEGETVTITGATSDTLNFTAPTVMDNEILKFRITVSDGYYNVIQEVNVGVRKKAQIVGIYYYHNDQLGTPQVMSDEAANVVWQASYSPFGKAEVQVETITNNIRFPGQYFDSETNLHYNYFRYYDTKVGRYITSDPIGLAGGINTYGYAGGNPVNWVDLKGLNYSPMFWFNLGRMAHSAEMALQAAESDRRARERDALCDAVGVGCFEFDPNQYSVGGDNIIPFPGTDVTTGSESDDGCIFWYQELMQVKEDLGDECPDELLKQTINNSIRKYNKICGSQGYPLISPVL